MTSPLAGLSAKQQANAAAIVAEVKREGLPLQAAQIAITTAIVESGLLSQANSNVPESLGLPHDKVGNDGTSVGLFQQQNSWGTVTQRLSATSSTALFLARLPTGWQQLAPGYVAQKIQVSAYPDRYAEKYPIGSAVASALWNSDNGVNAIAPSPDGSPSGGTPQWKSAKGTPISAPPDGTYKSATDSSGKPTYVPTVTAATVTDAQATLIMNWIRLVNPSLYPSPPKDWHAKIPGAAPGFDTAADVLIHAYEQALQGNGLDVGGATPGLDIPNPLQFLSDIFKWLTNRNNWIRIGLFTLGGVLLLIVAILWFRGTDTGQSLPTVIPV